MKQNLVILCCVVLAACGSAVDSAQTVSGPLPYTVTSVEVTASETAAKGRFAADDRLAASTLAALDANLTKSLSEIPGGAVRATAVFKVEEMKLKEAAARSFGGINSMRAVMRIVDERGKALAKPVLVNYSDQAVNNQIMVNYIPVGLLFNQIRNSTDAATGEDLKKLVGGFTQLAQNMVLTMPRATGANAASATTKTSQKASGSAQAVKSSQEDKLSDVQLEAAVKQARQAAENEVQSKYSVACWSLMCEREVKRAQDEAEARVRREAALASN